jgi:hypothetical protein
MIAVDDMHQRKAEMARLADAFIALPGLDSVPEFPPSSSYAGIIRLNIFSWL